ncbi:MAG TPA: discoidin domain-containing protein, partial [Sphingomicrobium sp.]|nr:discoidin domain-containing protein [Sphingomicrobium sp.]
MAQIVASIMFLWACSSHSPPCTIVIESGHAPLNVIRPDRAIGGAIDGLPAGEVEMLFTQHNITAIQTAGLRPISYSLRTELAIDAWHWGEEGSWSDPAHHQGYWTTSDHPRRPVLTGWGYKLPRRGDSIDQAEDNGYSRLDDGDPRTFWKSNPYLDYELSHFSSPPQWVAVDLGRPQAISAAKIVWAKPHATQYRVQYWTAADPYDDEGHWRDFPAGNRHDGVGGVAQLRLAVRPIVTRFVRILLEKSSHRAPAGAGDIRDRLGFAIGEVGFGKWDNNSFKDVVRHAPDGAAQTQITVSSTDPWHRESDRDLNAEQPGFDRIFRSGLTAGAPVVVPVGILYDTPENAAAEFRFLLRRGYPVRQVEMGEEPDGQNVRPDDFAALYRQFAAAIRAVDPKVELGGPNLQDAISDTWLDDAPDRSWTRRFLAGISKGTRPDLDFFTFEYYPYDTPCGNIDEKLVGAADILRNDLTRLRQDGVPTSIPWVITEYGFSAFSGRAEVELPGALFDAGMLARFFAAGGSAAYLLGYGPDRLYPPDQGCAGYGELMLFGQNRNGQATWPTP